MLGIIAKLIQGAADAGFLYATDVRAADGELEAIELPERLEPKVVYGIAVVEGATPRARRSSSSTACSPSAGRTALRRGRLPAAPVGMTRGRWFPPLLVAALALVAPASSRCRSSRSSSTSGRASCSARSTTTRRSTLSGSASRPRWSPWRSSCWSARRPPGCSPRASSAARRSRRPLVELPLVLPPAVAGVGLLAAVGPRASWAGARRRGHRAGVRDRRRGGRADVRGEPVLRAPGTGRVRLARPALLEASRTLGASEARTFVRVAIPSARPSLVAGAALAWGRALGEFGATLMFAGSLQGVTQTAPLAIFARLSTDFTGALALSAVLVALSAGILLGVRLLSGSWLLVGLRLEARAGLGRLELDVAPRRRRRASAWRWPARRARARRACCAIVAGLLRPARGTVSCDGEVVARHRAGDRRASGAAPLRLPLPGVRAVPAHDRARNVAYGLARAAARRAPAPARGPCSIASESVTSPTAGRHCSRAASASASRSRARSRASRGRCCSTSRSRRSTRARAPHAGRELGELLREAGVPTLLVTARLHRGRPARRPGGA